MYKIDESKGNTSALTGLVNRYHGNYFILFYAFVRDTILNITFSYEDSVHVRRLILNKGKVLHNTMISLIQ